MATIHSNHMQHDDVTSYHMAKKCGLYYYLKTISIFLKILCIMQQVIALKWNEFYSFTIMLHSMNTFMHC